VESDTRIDGRLRVGAAERIERGARVEQSGVEEVRTLASGFECELPETQRVLGQGEFEEFALIGFHGEWRIRFIVLCDVRLVDSPSCASSPSTPTVYARPPTRVFSRG